MFSSGTIISILVVRNYSCIKRDNTCSINRDDVTLITVAIKESSKPRCAKRSLFCMAKLDVDLRFQCSPIAIWSLKIINNKK